MSPEIIIFDNNGCVYRSFILNEGYTTFGRLPNSEICLDDPSVDVDYGFFSFRRGIFMIEASGSLQGVYKSGILIKRSVLYSGDVLTIGSFEVKVIHGTFPNQ